MFANQKETGDDYLEEDLCIEINERKTLLESILRQSTTVNTLNGIMRAFGMSQSPFPKGKGLRREVQG